MKSRVFIIQGLSHGPLVWARTPCMEESDVWVTVLYVAYNGVVVGS